MPSAARLFLKRTPWNFPLPQLPMKNTQRSVKIFAILRMFLMLILGMIVNQATNNNKPPVIHRKELLLQVILDILGSAGYFRYFLIIFRKKYTMCVFSICYVKKGGLESSLGWKN